MDHQQNFEYNDPNSFGFINSFPGSENFLIAQQQGQVNGKHHSDAATLPSLESLQSFETPVNTTSSDYTAQPAMMYQLSENIVPAPLFESPVGYQNMTPVENSFNINNPPASVPADIIQDSTTDSSQQLISVLEKTPQEVSEELTSRNSPDASSSVKPSSSIYSPEQNNMMKALGVMRREVLSSSGSKKRRRRILQLNDDDESDDDAELKKQLLQDSPEKEKPDDEEDVSENSGSESDDPTASNDPEAIKARFLLKSAVIIQGPDSKKKKKKRVLESDDEDELLTSVDDIGLIESNENDEDDEEFNSDIIITEPIFQPEEEIEKPSENLDKAEHKFVVPAAVKPPEQPEEAKPSETVGTSGINEQPKVDIEPAVTKEVDVKVLATDSSNCTIKTETGEIDPSLAVEAILDSIKPMADDDEFFKVDTKSDDSDCQVVSNEAYFGTPDVSKQPPSRNRKRPNRSRRPQDSSGSRKRNNQYEKDFVDGSSESEDTEYSASSAESSESSEEERPRPVFKKSPVIVQAKSFTVTKVPIRKKLAKKDRFYDRSQDIPNDVYFGDVNVPLNVLHSSRWTSDVDSSDSSDLEIISSSRFGGNSNRMQPSYSFDPHDDPKLSTLKEFVRVAGMKLNYGKLFDGMRSTDDKCRVIRRILAQKGMPGEPTVAKCKQLKLELQAKRESAELDKSVIIPVEGRTRRATRNVASKSPFAFRPSSSGAVVQPETLQTLSKIKRVVDTDSE